MSAHIKKDSQDYVDLLLDTVRFETEEDKKRAIYLVQIAYNSAFEKGELTERYRQLDKRIEEWKSVEIKRQLDEKKSYEDEDIIIH